MSNIKREFEKVYDKCTKLYEQGGVSAVIDHVNEQMELNNPLYADVEFMQCTPCNAEQPVLDNICLVCGSVIDGATIDGHLGPEGKAYPEIGRKIRTIGEVRELIQDLDNRDIAVLEACDANGDVEDLYPMYIDVIEGIELNDGTIVREVRFCQMPNNEIKLGTGILDENKNEIKIGDTIILPLNIDWSELQKQKNTLVEVISKMKFEAIVDDLNGIVHLLDALQDNYEPK